MTTAISIEDVAFAYGKTPILHDISLDVRAGRCMGIIGESGSGKSTLAKLILGLLKPSAGRIAFAQAGGAQMVFQDPTSCLNPMWSVWRAIAEGALLAGMRKSDAKEKALALMDKVKLDRTLADRKPLALSGGQRQRVGIARALCVAPSVLVLDEPTSALDLTVQAAVLDLLLELQDTVELTYVFITHDIDVVRHMAHDIAVMRKGQIVETGTTESVLSNPSQDYTRTLLESAPTRALGLIP